jgi:hypothetical protein
MCSKFMTCKTIINMTRFKNNFYMVVDLNGKLDKSSPLRKKQSSLWQVPVLDEDLFLNLVLGKPLALVK